MINPAAKKSLGKEPGNSALGVDGLEGAAALGCTANLAPWGET